MTVLPGRVLSDDLAIRLEYTICPDSVKVGLHTYFLPRPLRNDLRCRVRSLLACQRVSDTIDVGG